MKSQKNICFSQEQNKSMEVIDVLAFYTRLYVYFTYTVRTHLSVFLVYTACICPFLVFMCSNTNRLSFMVNQPILCSTYVFEIFLCLLLSFFVVDFVCRFNLLNYEFCVKAFLKRLSIYFPYPSDLVVIIPRLAVISPADKPPGGHASRQTRLQADTPPGGHASRADTSPGGHSSSCQIFQVPPVGQPSS